jgi:hypothetical protein
MADLGAREGDPPGRDSGRAREDAVSTRIADRTATASRVDRRVVAPKGGRVIGRRAARSETVRSGIDDQAKGTIARHLHLAKGTIVLRLVHHVTTEVGTV